jgi:glycerol uptake facilitator-like aquaporin
VLFKIFVVVLLLFVIFSLGSAMFYLVRDKGQSDKMLKALTWRIGLSVFIFILLLVGQYTGWIMPHSL